MPPRFASIAAAVTSRTKPGSVGNARSGNSPTCSDTPLWGVSRPTESTGPAMTAVRTVNPAFRTAFWRRQSLWIATRGIRGVTVHDDGGDPARPGAPVRVRLMGYTRLPCGGRARALGWTGRRGWVDARAARRRAGGRVDGDSAGGW